MKKIIVLLSIIFAGFIVSGCTNNSSKIMTNKQNNINEKMVGGPCEFNNYQGICKIISIQNNNGSNLVKYNFNANDKNFTKYNKIFNLELANGENPTNYFLNKYDIKEGKEFKCSLQLIKKGTCSPQIIKFDKINLTDYDSNKNIIGNKYLDIDVLNGWKATKTNTGEIIIKKGNYILNIKTNYGYAGGAENGVFNVIAENLPRKRLVINFLPAIACGKSIQKKISENLYETYMLYSNKDFIDGACNKLKDNNKTIWYVSYFTNKKDSYFYHINSDNTEVIITAIYDTNDINNLPESNKINYSLMENIKTMIKSIKIKNK